LVIAAKKIMEAAALAIRFFDIRAWSHMIMHGRRRRDSQAAPWLSDRNDPAFDAKALASAISRAPSNLLDCGDIAFRTNNSPSCARHMARATSSRASSRISRFQFACGAEGVPIFHEQVRAEG
jgi:hypothetical protein